MLPSQHKFAFIDLWIKHQFDISSVAKAAHVGESVVNAMMESRPVSKDDAEMVLLQLSRRYGCDYSLETVHVVITHSMEGTSDILSLIQKIDTDFTAAMIGMSGFAEGTTRHEFITKKMENMGASLIEMNSLFGEDAVLDALIRWQDSLTDNYKQASPNE